MWKVLTKKVLVTLKKRMLYFPRLVVKQATNLCTSIFLGIRCGDARRLGAACYILLSPSLPPSLGRGSFSVAQRFREVRMADPGCESFPTVGFSTGSGTLGVTKNYDSQMLKSFVLPPLAPTSPHAGGTGKESEDEKSQLFAKALNEQIVSSRGSSSSSVYKVMTGSYEAAGLPLAKLQPDELLVPRMLNNLNSEDSWTRVADKNQLMLFLSQHFGCNTPAQSRSTRARDHGVCDMIIPSGPISLVEETPQHDQGDDGQVLQHAGPLSQEDGRDRLNFPSQLERPTPTRPWMVKPVSGSGGMLVTHLYKRATSPDQVTQLLRDNPKVNFIASEFLKSSVEDSVHFVFDSATTGVMEEDKDEATETRDRSDSSSDNYSSTKGAASDGTYLHVRQHRGYAEGGSENVISHHGGFAVNSVQLDPDPSLLSKVKKILQALNYKGLGCVDLKYKNNDLRRPVLLEINPRTCGAMMWFHDYGEWIRSWALIDADPQHPCEKMKRLKAKKRGLVAAEQGRRGQVLLLRKRGALDDNHKQDHASANLEGEKHEMPPRPEKPRDYGLLVEKINAEIDSLKGKCEWKEEKHFEAWSWSNYLAQDEPQSFGKRGYPSRSMADSTEPPLSEVRIKPWAFALVCASMGLVFFALLMCFLDFFSVVCGYRCDDASWVNLCLCRCRCCCCFSCCRKCYEGPEDKHCHCRCCDRWWARPKKIDVLGPPFYVVKDPA
ncbi:unnamed protein product [Amoebophrya sp. A25]|nr:unnamed protein product [Amoebophrya sp. A25]|eukprot:GSA25T00014907001.1